MVKHIILWKLNDDLSPEDKKKAAGMIRDGLEGLAGQIDGLLDIHVIIEPMQTSTHDIMLECTLKDAEALAGYAVHPAHVKVKDGIIAASTHGRVCIDYTL
ncbi:MAG: Dabb family protein [Solobacterium sp.]|nr:Dabb family protein [Solobacterium sp.]MBQ6355943.1 Dabb family protein [Solobacterium sp.]MBQ6531682.1 Dabb family protein [Solobacterium sp.]